MKSDYDICVIGAGPGGYVAAIRAAQLGAKVVIVEKDLPGGTCLNRGCIPTKTLLASVEVLKTIRKAERFGITLTDSPKPDWKAMLSRKDKLTEKLRKGISGLLNASKVEQIKGTAEFRSRKKIAVHPDSSARTGKEHLISAEKIIIATGSEPLFPSFIPKDDRILTSTELLEIGKIPDSLTILGGGVIACEFASMLAPLGTKISIIEMLPQILPSFDSECVGFLAKEMTHSGIKISVGNKVTGVVPSKDSVVCETASGEKFSSSILLAAIGRKPVLPAKLELAGIVPEKGGFISVDSKCRTKVPGIYAIGDLTGRIQLAHLASAMGIVAAENACGNTCEFRDNLVPNCVFTSPELASVGLSEELCENRKLKYKTGKFPFAALGKAMAIDDSAGFCKIIADAETDQILGVHIVGPHATDLIAEAVAAMNLECTATEMDRIIHAHPTLPEAIMEAAHDLHGKSIHIPSKKK